jgi:hypothetical protein
MTLQEQESCLKHATIRIKGICTQAPGGLLMGPTSPPSKGKKKPAPNRVHSSVVPINLPPGQPHLLQVPSFTSKTTAMPPKKTRAPVTTPSRPKNSPSSTQAKKKKTPIAWDKDGAGGMSSIRILIWMTGGL